MDDEEDSCTDKLLKNNIIVIYLICRWYVGIFFVTTFIVGIHYMNLPLLLDIIQTLISFLEFGLAIKEDKSMTKTSVMVGSGARSGPNCSVNSQKFPSAV